MTRLVLFLIFLTISTIILGFSSYKKYFNESRVISVQDLDFAAAKKEKEAAQSQAASAEEAPQEDVIKPVVLDTPELKRGKELYTGTGECLRCHGEQGQGNPAEEAPLIGGQHDWYILDQLVAMKKGERNNEKMIPMLKKLSQEDFKALAAYISKLRVQARAE